MLSSSDQEQNYIEEAHEIEKEQLYGIKYVQKSKKSDEVRNESLREERHTEMNEEPNDKENQPATEEEGDGSWWQCEERGAYEVMCYVLSWLDTRQAWRAGASCHVWRVAAEAVARRRVLASAGAAGARRLLAAAGTARLQEVVARAAAGWVRAGRLQLRNARLLHAALDRSATRLALLDDDAGYTIWERRVEGVADEGTDDDSSVVMEGVVREALGAAWQLRAAGSVRARGWENARRAAWAPAGHARLLLLGPLLLAPRWQLLVLEVGRGAPRELLAAEGGGGRACWAGGGALLVPRLLAAPGAALTALTLWAADGAGDHVPLLNVYNEAAAPVSHLLVVPDAAPPLLTGAARDRAGSDDSDVDCGGDSEDDDVVYLRSNLDWVRRRRECNFSDATATHGTLLVARGCANGPPRLASCLAAWQVELLVPPRPAPPPGTLRVRALAHAAADMQAPEPPPPSVEELRARCTPPEATLPLDVAVLALQPAGAGAVWALTVDGAAWCARLPALQPLRRLLPPPGWASVPAAPYYAALTVVNGVVAGTGPDGRAWVQGALGGGARWLHGVADGEVRALLAVNDTTLLLVQRDGVTDVTSSLQLKPTRCRRLVAAFPITHTPTHLAMASFLTRTSRLGAAWARQARGMSSGRSSAPPPPPCGSGCVPCKQAVQPPCRGDEPPQHLARLHACCPPATGTPPPCPQPQMPVSYTCANPLKKIEDSKRCIEVVGCAGPCGASQDRVALRLSAARDRRRAAYEAEVCAPPPHYELCDPQHCLPPANHFVHASDGREYRLKNPPPPPLTCGPDRCPPEPLLVPLAHEDCPMRPVGPPDVCDHQPRHVMRVDHSAPRHSAACAGAPLPCGDPCTTGTTRPQHRGSPVAAAEPQKIHLKPSNPCVKPTGNKGIASRIMRRLSLSGGEKSVGDPSSPCGPSCPRRRLHSLSALSTPATPVALAGRLEEVLKQREELREAGRGRITKVGCSVASTPAPTQSRASLELPVSSGGHVSVQVSLMEPPPPTVATTEAPMAFGGLPAGCENWLRGLQKKFTPIAGNRESRPKVATKKTKVSGGTCRSNAKHSRSGVCGGKPNTSSSSGGACGGKPKESRDGGGGCGGKPKSSTSSGCAPRHKPDKNSPRGRD